MSIIEKAASRIDLQRASAAQPLPAGPVPDTAAALVPPVLPPVLPLPGLEAAQPAMPAQKPGARTIDIDLARLSAMGMITAASGRTALVEEFRIIKRPLLQRAFAQDTAGANPGNLIMITSSLPGEGKTWCAINLAMSIAMELDHTVLLVDADVARPSVLRTLGQPNQRGLMDLLVDDKLDMADVMLRTNVDALSILPAGTPAVRSTELLASSGMSALVREIASRYPDRIVIFDSPPLLPTSEASVLATHMGQIAMVVEAETTTQHAVMEALGRLEGCSNVNLIYNKSRDFPGIDETYGYHYG